MRSARSGPWCERRPRRSPLSEGEGWGEGFSTTAFGYDAVGRKTSLTEAAGTCIARTTGYQYDLAGQLVGTIDPAFRTTHYVYDALGRQASATV